MISMTMLPVKVYYMLERLYYANRLYCIVYNFMANNTYVITSTKASVRSVDLSITGRPRAATTFTFTLPGILSQLGFHAIKNKKRL